MGPEQETLRRREPVMVVNAALALAVAVAAQVTALLVGLDVVSTGDAALWVAAVEGTAAAVAAFLVAAGLLARRRAWSPASVAKIARGDADAPPLSDGLKAFLDQRRDDLTPTEDS